MIPRMTEVLPTRSSGWTDPADYGFSPDATGIANADALQRAVDRGGTILVTRPGTYDIARTVYVGSHTSITFGAGVVLRKVDEAGPFSHVLLNRGALSRTTDHAIGIHGLHLSVNGQDHCTHAIFGLRGQIAFFHVQDLRITGFRCYDLERMQYCIHVCSFQDLAIEDVIIYGKKDGIHLGRGQRFAIRNCVFRTVDDAIALNAHDYDTGNPELGWIENGVIENCHDLNDGTITGFFCRILAGGWCDWREGMQVQKSDSVISQGRLYRVRAEPDGSTFISRTRPTHAQGAQVLDGITWQMVQPDATQTAGVRNVVVRDAFLSKPRIAFSIHFDNDKYSRSYYPGAPRPEQRNIALENINILHDQPGHFLSINTPIDLITASRCSLPRQRIRFHGQPHMHDERPTRINLIGCVMDGLDPNSLLDNAVPGKQVEINALGTVVCHAAS
jgi:hypothetical protein